MDRKLFTNYFFNMAYQIVLILSPLIVVPYTTRVLGAGPLGVNTFSNSVVQWFVIFGIMGINTYGNKTIATVRDNREDLSKTFYEIYFMQLLMLISSFLLYFVFVFISQSFSLDQYLQDQYFPQYFNIFLVQGLTLLTVMVDITWFYLGIEDFKRASIRNIIVKIVGIVLIFTFVKSEQDLLLFVLINTVSALLGQMIMWMNINEHIDFRKPSLKSAFKHFKPNLVLFIPQVAISVYVVLDQTMTGILSTKDQVAFYAQSQKFVKMFLFFITSIGAVMLPRIANTHAKGNHEEINRYLQSTFKIAMYLAIPMMFGMIGAGPVFASWFLPEEFSSVGWLIATTAPIIIFISMSNVFGIQYMVPTGKSKKYSKSVIVGAVTNFIINLILIPILGAFGAAIGSVVAEFSVMITQWVYIRDELKLHTTKFVIKYFILGAMMSGIVFYLGVVLGPGLVTNLIQVGVGAVFYLGMLTVLKDPFHMLILNKGLHIVKGKVLK